jgi:glycosyltransferase involved in cell wall biosynthesis
MKILILSWRGPGHPLAGGAEQVTWEYAKGWTKAGHQVTLFTSGIDGANESENIDGIQVIRRGDQFFGVKLAAVYWYFAINRSKFDLIVDEFHGLPFFSPVWSGNTKKIGFIHEIAQKVWDLNPWPFPLNKVAAFLGKLGEPWIFKLFYHHIPFLTVSESTKKDLEHWGVRKIEVVKNGVLLPTKLPKIIKNKDLTLVYLSAIAKDKGIEDALKAFKMVLQVIPEVRFLVMGKGYPEYLRVLKKICPEAQFLGFVEEEEKFKVLSRSHFLIFPSVYEGWGLVVIEAAAVGTPTIGYDVAGVRDSVVNRKTGLLVPAMNIQALVKTVLSTNIESLEYKKMCDNAILHSKRFDWNQSVKKSLKFINSL